MMNSTVMKVAVAASFLFALSACGAKDSELDLRIPPTDADGSPISASIGPAGPRLPMSDLSSIPGARDSFSSAVAGKLSEAAHAIPRGTSQSSFVAGGRTVDEIDVVVGRNDDGQLVYMLTDNSLIYAEVPGPQRQGLSLALFTDLIPGIEPDLSSYPHELLGVWATDEHVGAYWTNSQSLPTVKFSAKSPVGTATYEGDAVGLRASGGAATKFLADVRMVADFDAYTVSGEVNKFRSLAGAALDGLSVSLGETSFPAKGGSFAGETTATVPGGGNWGARWSDEYGWTMGGTFGFAATDGSVAVLGAFNACSCASATDGDPDDPVATSQ